MGTTTKDYKFTCCLTCRNSVEGLVSIEVRMILCNFCNGENSNYSQLSENDIDTLMSYQRMIDEAKKRGSTIRFDPAWADL